MPDPHNWRLMNVIKLGAPGNGRDITDGKHILAVALPIAKYWF